MQFAICSFRRAFTLVELLVVIAIIGILAALIATAAVGALGTARRNAIKTELDQIHMAFQTYADTNGSYPPNCQIDDTSTTGSEPANAPLNESQVLTDLRRHLKQAFPRHREDENLLRVLAGLSADTNLPNAGNYPNVLAGGMSAGEAIVFWLGGFSDDPRYPISGEGGPSYRIDNLTGGITANQADPIESRKWVFPFVVARLGPRGADNYFDNSSPRFIQYTVNVNGVNQTRRINFWQYTPARSQQPYLYFDTSRHPPEPAFDPPAATALHPTPLHVHAIKKLAEPPNPDLPIQFATPDKFQILHCGTDGAWGEDAFERMSWHGVQEAPSPNNDPTNPNHYLLFPTGPFTGDVADTIVNFSEATLEASQP